MRVPSDEIAVVGSDTLWSSDGCGVVPHQSAAPSANSVLSVSSVANFPQYRRRRPTGISIIELLVALAITALLLTATMMATDASFKAYADAAQQASTQAATRMVTTRLLTLIRTGTAQGPLVLPIPQSNPAVILNNDTLTSPFMTLQDQNGDIVTIAYDPATYRLLYWAGFYSDRPAKDVPVLVGGVINNMQTADVNDATKYEPVFTLVRRRNDAGTWVLDRATIDLRIVPGKDADTTLALEYRAAATPIHVTASTSPRKLEGQ